MGVAAVRDAAVDAWSDEVNAARRAVVRTTGRMQMGRIEGIDHA